MLTIFAELGMQITQVAPVPPCGAGHSIVGSGGLPEALRHGNRRESIVGLQYKSRQAITCPGFADIGQRCSGGKL
jgi:hypothetical protein